MAIKYKWLAGCLEDMVNRNIKKGVNKLPTEMELCSRYHVSRQTVRMALSILEQKGLIRRQQGSGAYITGLSLKPEANAVAVLVSSSQEYIYPRILNSIHTVLSQEGFQSQVFVTDNLVEREREILLEILKAPFRGIIVEGCKTAFPNPNLELYRRLAKKGCRIVFLYNYYPGLNDIVYIKDDNFYGSSMLVRYLASQGHKHIAGIFKFDDMQGVERYQGMAETMYELNLPFSDRQIGWYGSRQLRQLLYEKDSSFLASMIQEILPKATAVICYNDIAAYYLIDRLIAAGFHLPSDIAVAAFDNTYLSNSNILTVTTLSHKPGEMGERAAQAVLQRLKGLPVSSQEVPWTLNLKESTRLGPDSL